MPRSTAILYPKEGLETRKVPASRYDRSPEGERFWIEA